MIEPTSHNLTEHDSPNSAETPAAPQKESAVGNQTIESHQSVGKNDNDRFIMVLRGIWNLPANVAIFLVRIYQWTLSPIIGRQCRFHPSCSNYYILAVRKYGFVSGTLRGFWRIVRCNPLCRGGEDFP
jgi:putative membrane protein insertion efficiency factor